MRTLVVVAVAACAAAPAPVITNRPDTPTDAMPALFAPLFRPRTWSFTGQTTVGDQMGHHRKRAAHVTCEIKTTRALAHAWLADFRCTGIEADQQIDGTLVATTAGLWHVSTPIGEITDETVAKLSPLAMMLGASPHAGEHTTAPTDAEQETFAVVAAQQAWCANYSTNIGDDRGWTMCIDATHGLVGGQAFWTGNETTTTHFGEAP